MFLRGCEIAMPHVPEQLKTPANMVTCLRVVGTLVWMCLATLLPSSHILLWTLFLLYCLLAATDKLDGYLARSRGEVSVFGQFLDPIADKLLVVAVLAYLVEHQSVSSLILALIVLREFLVSGLRMVVSSHGVVVEASWLGKLKTAVTMLALGVYLLVPLAIDMQSLLIVLAHILIAAATLITIYSGVDYFVQSFPHLIDSSSKDVL